MYSEKTNTYYVDPIGNVEIILTADVRVRVSSDVLCETSCFFNSMLSERWPEGQILASEGIVVVYLPDDPPVAFVALMYALHDRAEHFDARKVAHKIVVEIALLYDKYLVKYDMRYRLLEWREGGAETFPKVTTKEDVIFYIWATYTLNLVEEFRWATENAITQGVDSSIISIDGMPGGRLPDLVSFEIEFARMRIYSNLKQRFHGLVANFHDCGCPDGKRDCVQIFGDLREELGDKARPRS